jgi:hypothetical protein
MIYYVKWEPTNITFSYHLDVYLDYPFFGHQLGIYFLQLRGSLKPDFLFLRGRLDSL